MHILVVDSYGRSGATLARLLNLQGNQAQWAPSVTEALRLCEHAQFDLLITDLQLTDGTGAQLLELLVRRCAVRAVSLSADFGEEVAASSRRAGFAAHLSKPVSFEQLCDTIAKI